MASIKQMETKDGKRFFQISVSRGYGKAPYKKRWYWPDGWSKRTAEREAAKGNKGINGERSFLCAFLCRTRAVEVAGIHEPCRRYRRMNAERFQQQFYSSTASEEPAAQPDPLQQLDAGEKQALLIKLLAESPEMATMIKSLTQAM